VVLSEHRTENIMQRFAVILAEINDFFDHKPKYKNSIQNLTKLRLARLFTQKIFNKLKQKYCKWIG
jgi:hypothetical protein